MSSQTASFEEIRVVARSAPAKNPAIQQQVQARLEHLALVEGQLGELASLSAWVAEGQRTAVPCIRHPRLALFAATHGRAAELPEGAPEAVRRQIARLIDGNGIAHRLSEAADADFRLYEMGLDLPCADSRRGPAMNEPEAARAVAYGMMAVEPGVDLLIVAALGIGADLAAGEVERALDEEAADPLAVLAAKGGPDIAAMLGAILAARLAGVPVMLDGSAALAAAALAARLIAGVGDHCRAATPRSGSSLGGGFEIPHILSFSIDPPLAGLAAVPLAKTATLLLA